MARQKVTSATIYVDPVNGLDTNDGSQATQGAGNVGPAQTIQHGVDIASNCFDLQRVSADWTSLPWVGVRPGITVQLAPATALVPYSVTEPVYCDGLNTSGPITILGDLANPQNYNIYFHNSTQGFTAQDGGVLTARGVSISSDYGCTMINALEHGRIVVDTVYFNCGDPNGQGNVCIGADGHGIADVIGPIWLAPTYYIAIFAAIGFGRLVIGQAPINIDAAIGFGNFFQINSFAHLTCETSSGQSYSGAGVAHCTGSRYLLSRFACIDFDPSSTPGNSAGSAAPGSWINNALIT